MRSSDQRARRPTQQLRHYGVDLRLATVRDGVVPPLRCDPAASRDELSFDEIVGTATALNGRPGSFLLSGEPLRRRDARELLTELAQLRPDPLGICTSGEGVTAAVIERLLAVGVKRVHVPFHCARQDAHDWLVGRSGALKSAHRTIRACVDAGMIVAAEVTLTRPTVRHLAETVEVLARLGVRTVYVRRLTVAQAPGPDFVPLSPRLGLLGESLEQAAATALERRVRLWLRDLPLCVAPRLRPLFAAPDSELQVLADGSVRPTVSVGQGCSSCPGAPQCAGVPEDYTSRFGWEEFSHPRVTAPRVHESVADQQAPDESEVMTFAWRGPRRVRCEACAESTIAEANPQHAYESTRVIRARLVEAARYRPALLRLVGADLLAHPQAALLLYDAVRLFRRVEVAGEASPIVDWTDLDLRRLKELRRIDAALYGPDAATHDAHCGIPGAFAATLRALERLRNDTAIQVGTYAVLHDARLVPAFADAWLQGALPGEPRFRLSGKGGSLDDLAHATRALPAGAAHTALLALLPRCGEQPGSPASEDAGADRAAAASGQLTIRWGRSVGYQPGGSDPLGAFETCEEGAESCSVSGCPGKAVGWNSTARSQRWNRSI